MKKRMLFAKNYHWHMLLMRVVVNMLALLFAALLVPRIYFGTRTLGTWLWLALVLGVLNAVIKPIIQLLTLQFIFATGGLVVILINGIILQLLSWLLPELFVVERFFWALVGGAVLGLSAAFLESLLGLSPPIVSEKYPEIRQRVKDRQFYRTQTELARIEARKTGGARELATAKVLVSSASASVTQYVAPAKFEDAIADGVVPDESSAVEEGKVTPPTEPDTIAAVEAPAPTEPEANDKGKLAAEASATTGQEV